MLDARTAGARTRPAVLTPRDRNRTLDAAQRFLERHLHLDVQICAALLRGRAPTLGEHLGEQIAEGRRMVRTARREVESFEPRRLTLRRRRRAMPGVVARAARRIDQRLVCLENLPESLLGRLITRIDVRVISTRKTTVRPLDLGLRRPLRHAQNDVQIH